MAETVFTKDMTNTAATISTTDLAYYADHTTAALKDIAERYAANGAFTAQNFGADHPMAVEALKIANTAWAELVRRGEA